MKDNYYLEFKWTVSRGRDTYGYNICSLYVDGKKVTSCNGGGYDMQGTCFGDWIENTYQEQLKTLDPKEYYGMRVYDDSEKIYCDGACGFSSMERILVGLGWDIKRIPTILGNDSIYHIFKQIQTK